MLRTGIDEFTSSTESASSSAENTDSFKVFSKLTIQKLIDLNDDKISCNKVITRNAAIKERAKRVMFNLTNTQFIKCIDCCSLITYTTNTKSANRHFINCVPSSISSNKHTGKITSHLYNQKLPSDIKSDLAIKASRVCYEDVRTFSMFNGSAFNDYCQELLNLGALYGKLEYKNVGPDRTTVKNYTIKNAEKVKDKMIEHFKDVSTFVVSDFDIFLIK